MNEHVVEALQQKARERSENERRWDNYFMNQAKMAATNSKCFSRHIGAVLVKDKRVIGTGYNGPPAGVRPCDERWILGGRYDEFMPKVDEGSEDSRWGQCPRRILGLKSGMGLEHCSAGHAERNALLSAGRIGTSTVGATLYCYCGQVCKDCAIEIINAGVTELVFLDNLPDYDALSGDLLKESGIIVRRIPDETFEFVPHDSNTLTIIGKGVHKVEDFMDDEGISYKRVAWDKSRAL